MTPDEAKHALLAMSQAWPTKISDPTLHLWNNRLTRLDFAQTIKAIDKLMDTSKFWPSWAELKETVDAINNGTKADWQLEPVANPASLSEARRHLAEMRATLQNAHGK